MGDLYYKKLGHFMRYGTFEPITIYKITIDVNHL
jgi:hypothetical protein